MGPRARSLALAVVSVLGAPACAATPPASSGPSPAATIAAPDAPDAPSPQASAPPAEVAPRGRVRYELARHLERAEVRQGPWLFVDHGAPGGDKYTLGGWTTAVSSHLVDGVTVAVGRDSRARFALPWDAEGELALVLRARAFRAERLQIYVNETELHAVDLPGDGSFVTTRVTVPASVRRGSENELLLRVRGATEVRGIGSAGVALDWMRVGPAGAPEPPDLPAGESLAFEVDGVPALRVPAEATLAFATVVPDGARLRSVVRVPAGGALELVAVRDGAPSEPLARVAGGAGPQALDADLGALAGDVARLELRAIGAPVELLRPAVVTFDEVEVATPRRPRNVLVYLVDTLRADKLQPYRPASRVQTPGLARFVEAATTLAGAHAQENWTKPSVATLLSALMPWEHTATQSESVLPASVRILPELLSERGFFTGCFIANGYVSDRFGFRQGWDTYRNYIREGRRTQAEFVAADVVSWLDARPADRPFFLYVHTIDPHVPYRPPAETLRLYGDPDYRGPVSFGRDATLLENVKLGRIRLEARDRAHLEALYDGEITYHDVHFASILEALERRGLAEDTMVVVTSDHGEEFWDHGSVGHGHSVYEELVRVPLFVRLPGVTDALRRLDVPVGLVDVLPTVLEALGVEVPADVSGRSFLSELLGADQSAPRVAVSAFMDNYRTLVVDELKLIHRTRGRFSLHDLRTDPTEGRDLAAERPIAARYLRGLLGLELARTAREPSARAGAARPRPSDAPAHRAEQVAIDAETEAQLRALGYVGTSRP